MGSNNFIPGEAQEAWGLTDEVAKVVQHALTSHHPRTRYRVGQFASLIDLFHRFPSAIRDRIIERQLPPYGGQG